MSNDHDPFPMQSEEARRMAASVPSNDQGAAAGNTDGNGNNSSSSSIGNNNMSWNKMGTSTHVKLTNVNSAQEDTLASDALFSQSSGSRKKGSQSKSNAGASDTESSIYDDIDAPPSKAAHYLELEDEYLDQPIDGGFIHQPRSNTAASKCLTFMRKRGMALHKQLYGDKLPPSELLRTLCLSSTLFFMIGGYWLLRSLKDPVLTALCGVTAIPKAKMLSVFVVLVVVSIYNRLLDNPDITKHGLFYIFGSFYFVLFTVISLLLAHPTIGLPNQEPSMTRILGWISYCSIESFGSVMVSLFWSFANSNFSLETAKASYGLLVATAQVGSIIGPTIVSVYAQSWGVSKIYFVGAICMLLLQGTMYTYIKIYGTDESRAVEAAAASKASGNDNGNGNASAPPKKKGAGVLEGLHLFVKHHYVKGIFAISCLFMVEVTIVDYTMKVLARDHFAKLHPCTSGDSCMSVEATAAFTTFMGLFGQATNALSFLLSFFGTSAIIRYLGLRLALLLFPTLCLIVMIIVRLHPTLYVVFAAMMVLKANSYALNNPTKEMLYQPTSSAVRYKAKSWIDIFGARGSKAMGSMVTNAFSDSATTLVQNGSVVGMAVASFLIWNARYMGNKFEEYVASGYVVGGTEEYAATDSSDHMELAGGQNEGEDTSCAIYDDETEIKENISDHLEDQDGSAEDSDSEDEANEVTMV